MIITIADCNHGFFEPEEKSAREHDLELRIPHCTQDNFISKCHGSDIILVQRIKVDGSTIDAIPTCRVVARYGVGLDNINCDELKEQGVAVVNFPQFCTEEVANHTAAMIMFMYRKLDDILKTGRDLVFQWGNPNIIENISGAGSTVIGIVGVGRIGSSVATRMLSCGFRAIGYDPYLSDQDWAESGVERIDSLEGLFYLSDIVTLHVPLSKETEGMVDKTLLSKMKEDSCFVNASRGEVVITKDLIKALEFNIHSAFIDVCDPEPPPISLFSIHNLYISHHCSFYSKDSLNNLKSEIIPKSIEAYNAL